MTFERCVGAGFFNIFMLEGNLQPLYYLNNLSDYNTMASKIEKLLEEMGDSVMTPKAMGAVIGGDVYVGGPTFYKTHENTDSNGDGVPDDCAYEEDAEPNPPASTATSPVVLSTDG